MKNKRIKKISKKTIVAFIICAITFSMIGVGASSLLYSKDVVYDNSSSGLSSTNLQDALDELYEQAKTGGASVVCDDSGNCTVTCKQGDPTITDSGYSCTTTTDTIVTCPSDKPIYSSTSTGYKCGRTVEPTISSTSSTVSVTNAIATNEGYCYTSKKCYSSKTECLNKAITNGYNSEPCLQITYSYYCPSGTLNGTQCYIYTCPSGYESSGNGSSMTCNKYTCLDGFTLNTSDHLCYLN